MVVLKVLLQTAGQISTMNCCHCLVNKNRIAEYFMGELVPLPVVSTFLPFGDQKHASTLTAMLKKALLRSFV
jgi:hypothetical protein